MDEYDEIIKKLLDMGVCGCVDNGQIMLFDNIPICKQNENLKQVDIDNDAC